MPGITGLWLLKAGLCAGFAAVLAGAWDFVRHAAGRVETHRAALNHAIVMIIALMIYFAALVAAQPERHAAPLSVWLGAAGALTLLAGGWCGGDLVYGHGVGRSSTLP